MKFTIALLVTLASCACADISHVVQKYLPTANDGERPNSSDYVTQKPQPAAEGTYEQFEPAALKQRKKYLPAAQEHDFQLTNPKLEEPKANYLPTTEQQPAPFKPSQPITEFGFGDDQGFQPFVPVTTPKQKYLPAPETTAQKQTYKEFNPAPALSQQHYLPAPTAPISGPNHQHEPTPRQMYLPAEKSRESLKPAPAVDEHAFPPYQPAVEQNYLPPVAPVSENAYLPPEQLQTQGYLPPTPSLEVLPPPLPEEPFHSSNEYLPPHEHVIAEQPEKPVEQYLPAPTPAAQPTREYVPPSAEPEPAHELAEDGYHYKTVKRYRYRKH